MFFVGVGPLGWGGVFFWVSVSFFLGLVWFLGLVVFTKALLAPGERTHPFALVFFLN